MIFEYFQMLMRFYLRWRLSDPKEFNLFAFMPRACNQLACCLHFRALLNYKQQYFEVKASNFNIICDTMLIIPFTSPRLQPPFLASTPLRRNSKFWETSLPPVRYIPTVSHIYVFVVQLLRLHFRIVLLSVVLIFPAQNHTNQTSFDSVVCPTIVHTLDPISKLFNLFPSFYFHFSC